MFECQFLSLYAELSKMNAIIKKAKANTMYDISFIWFGRIQFLRLRPILSRFNGEVLLNMNTRPEYFIMKLVCSLLYNM